MTQTTQPCSWAVINKKNNISTNNKPETEDNRELLLSLFDSLNKLYEKLNRLNYMIQRRNLEQSMYSNNKGETNDGRRN
jgi:hypothetical protein